MRAIIVAPGYSTETSELNEHYPNTLFPLMDKPFIQHIVENLVEQGVTQFDILLHHLPVEVERLLGDGERWGSSFTFHVVRDIKAIYNRLKVIELAENEQVVFGHADRLPRIHLATSRLTADDCMMVYQKSSNAQELIWSGWALIRSSMLEKLSSATSEHQIETALKSSACSRLIDENLLCIKNYLDIFEANRNILNNPFGNHLAREIEPGVWISKGVSFDPSVKFVAPLFIGENCLIGSHTTLGPNVLISSDSIIDDSCLIKNSIIFADTYIGQSVELDNSIVCNKNIINFQAGTIIRIEDDLLFTSLSGKQKVAVTRSLLSRSMALLLLLLFSPLLFLKSLWEFLLKGTVFQRQSLLSTKGRDISLLNFASVAKEEMGKDFIGSFLPGLISVIKGEIDLVGVRPRTIEEFEAMPQAWKEVYINSKLGLVGEASIELRMTEEEHFSTEAYYMIKNSFFYDLKLLSRYFFQVFTGRVL
ncbi:MAG: sugar transferase [Blastocatellia bacterium]|nr:sugar transferase [Blastocatellia bacterium]